MKISYLVLLCCCCCCCTCLHPALSQETEFGIFANVAAGPAVDWPIKRGFTTIVNQGWPHYTTNVIQPLVDKYELQQVFWALPGGRDGRPMDFNGFAEIDRSIRDGNHVLLPAQRSNFQQAILEFNNVNPEMKNVFYVGSIAADLDISELNDGKWANRVRKELDVYRDIGLTKDRYTIGFDHFASVLPDGQPRVTAESREMELLSQLTAAGIECLIEPHPYPEDGHFFDYEFIISDVHWVMATNKTATKQMMRTQGTKAHILMTRKLVHWEEILNDPVPKVIYLPYAGLSNGIFDEALSANN